MARLNSSSVSTFSAMSEAEEPLRRREDAAQRLRGAGAEVELDVVGERDEAIGAGAGEEVVEGDAVAELFELLAGGEDVVVDLDGLEHLKHGAAGGQAGGQAADEGLAAAVDEGSGAEDEIFHAEQQRGIDHLRAGDVGISVEGVLRAGTEEQLVSVDATPGIQDGLAADEA